MLITVNDVQTYSPAGKSFPRNLLCDTIDGTEETFINSCLGWELWDYLIEKLNTADLEDAKAWQDCGDYAEGEIVIRNDIYFASTEAHNNTDPSKPGTPWQPVEKFTDECCNKLWEKYLRKALAYAVYSDALPLSATQPGAGGLIVQGADPRGQRGATLSEIAKLQESLQRTISGTLNNMKVWAQQAAQKDCGFPDSPALGSCSDCVTTAPLSSRTFLMRSE